MTIDGILAANSAGGGDEAPSPGAGGDAPNATPAPGTLGGTGGAGDTVNGSNGMLPDAGTPGENNTGAGGGGVGWIRINAEGAPSSARARSSAVSVAEDGVRDGSTAVGVRGEKKRMSIRRRRFAWVFAAVSVAAAIAVAMPGGARRSPREPAGLASGCSLNTDLQPIRFIVHLQPLPSGVRRVARAARTDEACVETPSIYGVCCQLPQKLSARRRWRAPAAWCGRDRTTSAAPRVRPRATASAGRAASTRFATTRVSWTAAGPPAGAARAPAAAAGAAPEAGAVAAAAAAAAGARAAAAAVGAAAAATPAVSRRSATPGCSRYTPSSFNPSALSPRRRRSSCPRAASAGPTPPTSPSAAPVAA